MAKIAALAVLLAALVLIVDSADNIKIRRPRLRVRPSERKAATGLDVGDDLDTSASDVRTTRCGILNIKT